LHLGDYIAVFARRRWPMLFVLLAILCGAVAVSLVQESQYRATASVLVRTSGTSNLFPLDGAVEVTRSVAGEQAFLNSNEFRDRAILLSPQPSTVRTISDEGNDDAAQRSVIAFEATASTASDAAQTANVWAATYIEQRHELEVAELGGSIVAVQLSLDGLDERRALLLEPLSAVDDAIEQSNDPVQIARLSGERLLLVERLSTELGAVDSQISRLNTNIAEMQVTQDLLSSPELSARLSETATPPGSPFSPNIARNLMLALVAGLIVSLGAALLLESLDKKVRSVDEVVAVTGLQNLTSVPRLQRRGVTLGMTEAYQRVVSALTLARASEGSDGCQVILVTSAQQSEGKTTTATSVARLFAKGRSRTLVIDADLHRPSAGQQLEVANRFGLSDYLAGTRSIDEVIFEVPGASYLHVIPSGRIEPGAALDLLRNPRFEVLIQKLRGAYDRVIIDTPPVLAVVDSVEAAVYSDCSVLVVRSGQLRASELIEAQRILESGRAPIVGTVLIAPSAEVNNVYAYRYG
jgi:capsular exopolysaccharide synthesis family protein